MSVTCVTYLFLFLTFALDMTFIVQSGSGRCLFGCCLFVLAITLVLSHECARPCVSGEKPKKCHYNLTIEWYLTMSKACFDCPRNVSDCSRADCVAADGRRRAFIAVNRQLPGPTIQVCHGDTVVAMVTNHLVDGQETTMHWHGIHQRGTPYMDGANRITQCPIPMNSAFRYEFTASPSGTHFYHSHAGFQRGDGVHGPLIVHSYPEDDPNYDAYDHDCATPTGHCEHHVLLTDWLNENGISRYMYLMNHIFDVTLPMSSLLNGRNKRYNVTSLDDKYNYRTPYELFSVKEGKRYRFRVIGASSMNCPFKVSVDNHTLTIIAADGHAVKPLEVAVFAVFPGERYDFILHTNQMASRTYWLRAVGLGDCAFQAADVFAVLRYNGSADEEPKESLEFNRLGRFFNPIFIDKPSVRERHGDPFDIKSSTLQNAFNWSISDEKVDVTHYIALDFKDNDNTIYNRAPYAFHQVNPIQATYTPVIDNITFKIPSVPVLSQPKDFDFSSTCNASNVQMAKCDLDLCLCTHMVHIKMHQVVELVLVNEGTVFNGIGHMMHLHGYSFWVIATGRIGSQTSVEEVRALYQAGNLTLNLHSPSKRDTINVPDGGYTIIRFKANNPGYWLFHCHVESHTEQGQALVFRVGDESHLPPVPTGFPRCGQHVQKQPVTTPDGETSSCRTIKGELYSLVIFLFIYYVL